MHTIATLMSGKAKVARRYVLVDIENSLGGSVFHADDVEKFVRRSVMPYLRREDDLAMIGVGYGAGVTAFMELRAAGRLDSRISLRFVTGPDGADRSLLELMSPELAERFEEVVLFSGDHIFAGELHKIRRAGATTTVAARRRSLSPLLSAVADEVFDLPESPVRGRFDTTDERTAA